MVVVFGSRTIYYGMGL